MSCFQVSFPNKNVCRRVASQTTYLKRLEITVELFDCCVYVKCVYKKRNTRTRHNFSTYVYCIYIYIYNKSKYTEVV